MELYLESYKLSNKSNLPKRQYFFLRILVTLVEDH